MRIISVLFLATAVANALEPPESYVENHLRGSNEEDRDLLTLGSSSKTIAFSFAACDKASNWWCRDYDSWCSDWGYGNISTDAFAEASGNDAAMAEGLLNLCVRAYCGSLATAMGQACAFTKANGKIHVYTKVENGKQSIDLGVSVSTSSMTLAFAKSEAVAGAYTEIAAQSFTSVADFCTSVGNMSPMCAAGTASTDLKTIGIAISGSKGEALSLAQSFSGSSAQVHAQGSVLEYAAGIVSAYATSWAFADAKAAAGALAVACSDVVTTSFAMVCGQSYDDMCTGNGGGLCSLGKKPACDFAWSVGQLKAQAWAQAYADLYIEACAYAHAKMSLQADIDCRTTPKLTYKCIQAAADTTCYA